MGVAGVVALVATQMAVSARGQRMERRARKNLKKRQERAANELEGRRKDALVGREQSLSASRPTGTAQQASGRTSTAGAAAQGAGQTLGNQDLFRRTLG